jgi:hypothetical protein
MNDYDRILEIYIPAAELYARCMAPPYRTVFASSTNVEGAMHSERRMDNADEVAPRATMAELLRDCPECARLTAETRRDAPSGWTPCAEHDPYIRAERAAELLAEGQA